MLYLYLGYVVIQLYAIVGVFSKNTLAASALFFSLVVFVIWSFIPILGYALAKAIGAHGHSNKLTLFFSAIIIALIENGLTYFNLLSDKQYNIGTTIVFLLFFLVAYIPLAKQKITRFSTNHDKTA
ncbi:hypothetical protein CXF85_06305 [Colwellia sp. 75C3]|uniref:hypothetical protein n=1 Tax=Colwellia sp. 75C3 TaxID=888425 RepID=UPI000C32561F|nr:hypothetical protein [Colwellia sp. 75C3]PKG85206.1 hypothetical protein CXF85_06305 [Colwellia sp. 75C3]